MILPCLPSTPDYSVPREKFLSINDPGSRRANRHHPGRVLLSPMARSANELHNIALALSANARALREASDAARDQSTILKEMSRTARAVAAQTLAEASAARRRQRDR
jgi:hypothetical protein